MPRVSVLLPVRDGATTLSAALSTVLRQTHRDLECVVVDDGSRDESASVAEAAARSDPRVRVIRRAPEGIVPALNAGLQAARGAWIARMDADDLMRRDRIARQLDLCEHSGLDACGAHVRLFPRRDLKEGARSYERWIASLASPESIARDAFVECPVVHPTLFVRAEILARHGYRDMGWPEDYDLVLRLLALGARVGVVPRRLLAWREGAGRHSRVDARYSPEAFARARAHFLARGFLARAREYVLIGYGPTGKLLRAALAAEDRQPLAIVDLHPGRIGQTIDGVAVSGPEALARLPKGPSIVCVAHAAPRALVREELARTGRRELDDFVCCA